MTPLAGQPAFPHKWKGNVYDYAAISPGLSKREYYAGLAMQGLMAAYQSSERLIGLSRDAEDHGEKKVEQTMARWAVEQADALIAELEKK